MSDTDLKLLKANRTRGILKEALSNRYREIDLEPRYVCASLNDLVERRGMAEKDGVVLNYHDIPLSEDHIAM
jgi:hypothetical protein